MTKEDPAFSSDHYNIFGDLMIETLGSGGEEGKPLLPSGKHPHKVTGWDEGRGEISQAQHNDNSGNPKILGVSATC
jgi:hypothetical protein